MIPTVLTFVLDDRITISSSTSIDRTNSSHILSITNVTWSDRKVYICFADNKHGHVRISTLLRVKGNLAWLWPAIGILIEVVTFGALSIFYFFKEKSTRESER